MSDRLEGLPFAAPDAWRFKRSLTSEDIAAHNPHWRSPDGVCRWCGEPIDRSVEEDRRRRNWHARCNRQFSRLFFSPRWIAEQRDHGICSVCGRDCDALDKRLSELQWKYRRRSERIARLLFRLFGWPFEMGRGRRSTWEADHVVPVSEGGGMLGEENIQTLCWWCHQKKTAGKVEVDGSDA